MVARSRKDEDVDDEQSDRSCISLTGNIRLQSDCRTGDRIWCPTQAIDLRESGGVDNGTGSRVSFDPDNVKLGQSKTMPFDPSHMLDSYRTRTSTFQRLSSTRNQLVSTHDGTKSAGKLAVFAQVSNESTRQEEVSYSTVGTHTQRFSNLPDPIRLSEQAGEFDGQVLFIGHPNRDVSAHQWSALTFQWVNIGRYSDSQSKIEGSLASDRLRGIDQPLDTLEHFKLAAENRQTRIVEHGRIKAHTMAVERKLREGVDATVSGQTCGETPAKEIRVVVQAEGETGLTLPSTLRNECTRHALEDPFVAPATASISQSSDGDRTQGSWINLKGSMDLTYRFPTKEAITAKPPVTNVSTFCVKSTGNYAPSFLFRPSLQEIAFGEEAASQRGSSSKNDGQFQRLRTNAAYFRVQGRPQVTTYGGELRSFLRVHQGLVSCTTSLETPGRHVTSTRSVLPVTYATSALNATAMPYSKIMRVDLKSGASEINASALNAAPVGLHYSDPDGLRIDPRYEVANGLNQQAPTPQIFKGPFFTESKPTTHDPTVALTIRVSEEEKLVNWFRDGHRPARQKEYTKSLIVAAAANDKTQHLEPIGEVSAKEKRGPYANTAPFVRLYENLSEYVEEYRNGSGQSYFTRRWKPAEPQLRASGLDINASYFSKGDNRLGWPRAPLFRPSERPWWG